MESKKRQAGNFVYLLLGLLVMLLTTALAQQFAGPIAQYLIQLVTIFALMFSVFSVSNNPKLFWVFVSILSCMALSAVASQFYSLVVLRLINLMFMGIFYLIMVVTVLRQVLFSGIIDNNKIIGAVCIYLIMGMLWTVLYSFVYALDATAINNIAGLDWSAQFSELIYFSFVTLSTLGYGDISPFSPIARFLVYTEALTGQFYLAILVASLIGAKFSGTNQTNEK